MNFARLKNSLTQKFVRDPAGCGRPVPAASFDREYQSGNWAHFATFGELPRTLVLAGAVNHFFPAEPSVLDLGAGAGRFAQALRHYPFSRYLGLDLSPAAVAQARALAMPRMEFIEGDFEIWRPVVACQAIVFNESIGYARDPAATLAAFSRHLQPGGRFFVSLYRSGSSAAQWRRMYRACETVEAATVAAGGKTWDIRILQPRA